METPDTLDYSATLPPERKEVLTNAYADLRAVYGIEDGYHFETKTLAEFLFVKYAYGHPAPEVAGETDWGHYGTMKAVYAVSATKHIHSALSILKDEFDVDILADRRALSDPRKFTHCIEGLTVMNGYNSNEATVREGEEDDFGRIFAVDIANLFGGNRQRYRNGIDATEKMLADPQRSTNAQLIATAQLSYYQATTSDMSSARYEAQKQLRALCSDEILALVDYGDEVAHYNSTRHENNDVATEILQSKKQELDYTILPEGTELREVAEQIAEESGEYTKAHIDLERLTVLEKVRQRIGPEKCYLMRGKSSDKGMLDSDGTLINEDYIGLIMQHHDAYGNVAREDCLAISPIARKHAGYIVRQDASEGISWREILALPKNDATQFFNARRLRFDPVNGQNKYDAYVDKVETLLSCDKDHFSREYVLKRTAEKYKMVHRGRPLGDLGLRAVMMPEI